MGELRMDLYLKHLRWSYLRNKKAQKKRGYHRKAAARLLRQLPIPEQKRQKPGKKEDL